MVLRINFGLIFIFLLNVALNAASISNTYNSGDIATNYGSYNNSCNGPVTTLAINLPAGGPWLVTSVDVDYNMTALSGAWKSEQRSKIHFQNTNTSEAGFSSGSGSSGGTQSYNRTGLTIANGSYTGGSALTFEMQAYRTWGGSGCNTTYNKVDMNTWTITVNYIAAPTCPAPSGLTAAIIGGNLVDVSWTENGTATAWDIELGLQGFAPTGTPTHNDVTNSYTFSGLIPDTDYEYYVRADCGGGDESSWEGPYSFTTPELTGMVYISGTPYATLKAAFDAINNGTYTGDITVTIGNADGQSITETTEAVLNKSGMGSASYTSVTIQPGAPNIKLKGAINGSCCVPSGIVKLNQAENVTVDGRVGGTGSTIDLMIENSYAGSYSSGFVFFAASNNILQYTHVKSAVTGTCCGNGTIAIADNNTSGGSGSSNNLIAYNIVSGSGSAIPRRAIAGKGANTRENQNNIIRGNTIFDFQEFGIYLGNGSSDGYNRNWIIEDNTIYQSTAFTSLSSDMIGIAIGQKYSTTGTELGTNTIRNNQIGGNGAGGKWQVTSTSSYRVAGIALNTITTAYTEVSGNTISNFDVKTTNTSTDYGMFTGIVVSQGKVNINNNTIGSLTEADNIVVSRNNTSNGGFVSGIQVRSSGDYENIINFNTVSGIDMTLGTGSFFNFYGIRNLSSTTYPADSVYKNNVSYITLTKSNYAFGIYAQGLIASNQIRDIDMTGAITSSELIGIRWSGGDITGTGSRGVENNEVILGLNRNGSSVAVNDLIKGIDITRGDAEVYYNTVLISGTGTSSDNSYGIWLASSGTTNFNNNLLYNERNSSGGSHYAVYSSYTNQSQLNTSNNAYITGTNANNYLGYWAGNISTLSAWQTASGETNALYDDNVGQPVNTLFPLYATQNTLDIADPSFLVAGTPITPLSADINDLSRDATTPTIGAHEATNFGTGLPIELVSFTAQCTTDGIKLEWETAIEINNQYFTIERSTNGQEFEVIGHVSGAGNSTQNISYSYIDKNNKTGQTIYYKLKQTDTDGSYKYFDLVATKCSADRSFGTETLIYPNPANNWLHIKSTEPVTNITVYDVLGTVICTTAATKLAVDELPSGMYYIQVETANGKTIDQFVKR